MSHNNYFFKVRIRYMKIFLKIRLARLSDDCANEAMQTPLPPELFATVAAVSNGNSIQCTILPCPRA